VLIERKTVLNLCLPFASTACRSARKKVRQRVAAKRQAHSKAHLRLAEGSESRRILGTHSHFNLVCLQVNTQRALKRDQTGHDWLVGRKGRFGAQFLFENVIGFFALLPDSCCAISRIPAAWISFEKLHRNSEYRES
jgi:hypothetical protein